MTPLRLTNMTPVQQAGWEVLLDLSGQFPEGWCLVGGQMVWLHAQERGIDPLRATEDIDVVVDIRTRKDSIRRLCKWLEQVGFVLVGPNPDGIGHRYVQSLGTDGGMVTFDVLAPDHLGARSDLTTTPPARTVEVPGGRKAVEDANLVRVAVGSRTGTVRRPSLLGAILIKVAATTIAVRANPERDWADIAFLLTLIEDPIGAADATPTADKRRLRQRVGVLLDRQHRAWRTCGERAELGQTALEFLLDA